MIKNASNGKPRGYAFIEFEKERDMHCKFKLISHFFSTPYTQIVG